MKKKKFFTDFFDELLSSKKLALVIVLLLVISCIVTYTVNYNTYTRELSNYSKEDYVYLSQTAINIYDTETKSLTLANVPNNISVKDIIYEQENTTYSCVLENGFWFVSNPMVHVNISNKLNAVEITGSNENYATNKVTLIILSVCFGSLFILIPLFIIYIIAMFIYIISYNRKQAYYKSISKV